MMLSIKVEAPAGAMIDAVIVEMIALANRMQVIVYMKLNDVTTQVYPDDDPAKTWAQWQKVAYSGATYKFCNGVR